MFFRKPQKGHQGNLIHVQTESGEIVSAHADEWIVALLSTLQPLQKVEVYRKIAQLQRGQGISPVLGVHQVIQPPSIQLPEGVTP